MSALDAHVRAVNRAHAAANEWRPKLIEAFEPYLGCKIEKADGSLLAKVKKVVDDLKLPYGNSLSIHRSLRSNYILFFTVRAGEVADGRSYNREVSLYIGEMICGVLTKMCEMTEFRTDFTPEKVLAAREAYKQAKKLADDAESALHPFGEYDR